MAGGAPTPDDLAAALAARPVVDHPALPGRRNHLRAGVLVTLAWDPAPVALLTLRPRGLRRHGGEVSFPGGKPEPEDRDLEATALREAREELGVEPRRVLGRLPSQPLYTSDYRLVPWVAEVPAGPLDPDPGEVERVLRLPLADVYAAARIDAIPFELAGETHLSPVFVVEGEVVFGGTAHTLYELLEVAAPLHGRDLPPREAGAYSWGDLLG